MGTRRLSLEAVYPKRTSCPACPARMGPPQDAQVRARRCTIANRREPRRSWNRVARSLAARTSSDHPGAKRRPVRAGVQADPESEVRRGKTGEGNSGQETEAAIDESEAIPGPPRCENAS